MNHWEILNEEASIVLVGNMNPKIFHPEWFIRKEIVAEWDYSKDEIISLPDMSQMDVLNGCKISVLLNKFSMRSSLESEYLSMRDLVIHTFSLLSETPILQMGMNFRSIIKIANEDKWMHFGSVLAPQKYWKQAANFIDMLDEDSQKELGLWELAMNLPRPDNLEGYVRPKIAVFPQAGPYTLEFNINNHVEITDASAATMIEILKENWDKSLDLAKELTNNIMESQLGGVK
ncbi:hypothetical protein [Methylobacter marinus]|uniref:hypothetical protein n=1 Tax=Methylobacter marinus TaxID=34058 RepID=UPI0003727E9A|nr:hypothetical protein [Methylobacter marinus]